MNLKSKNQKYKEAFVSTKPTLPFKKIKPTRLTSYQKEEKAAIGKTVYTTPLSRQIRKCSNLCTVVCNVHVLQYPVIKTLIY